MAIIMTSKTPIYAINEQGELSVMAASAPENEDYMQDLVARYPEIIADDDGDLLLIKREQGIGDGDSSSRWSVDHLFVTRSAVPVLVELKRAVDTRLRREVVGQMLDYAANATAYWKAGQIASSFAENAMLAGRDPDELLATFIGAGEQSEEFWQQVDANFSAGRIKMVFVADVIPRELARIVEFLNEQMRADVRAVELNWFESSDGSKAFTPRIIGQTERAESEKAARSGKLPMGKQQWIAEFISPRGHETVQALEHFEQVIVELGGSSDLTSSQGSIISTFEVGSAKLYPFAFTRYSGGAVQFNLGYLKSRRSFAEDGARQKLYDRLTAIVGPLSTETLNGYPAFAGTLLNDDLVRHQWKEFLSDLVETAASEG